MFVLKVLKFGGTSVGSSARLRQVARIVYQAAREDAVVVVVSAVAGVTDRLVGAVERLRAGEAVAAEVVRGLHRTHFHLGLELLHPQTLPLYEEALQQRMDRLAGLLAGAGPYDDRFRDEVLATGERLSVALVALLFRDLGLDAVPYDAADLILTDATHGAARVDLDATRPRVRNWYAALPAGHVPVVTGFIGSTGDGITTTLGRGGSDYSAALLASVLGASVMERWTDVDGIYTEDPRTHRDAKRLASIVLSEAQAWNHAGRLGMHRQALDPLVAAAIPVHVRSTADPDLPGTRILPAVPVAKQAVEG